VSIGILFSIALLCFVAEIRKINIFQKLAGAVALLLVVYSFSLYVKEFKSWLFMVGGIIVGIVLFWFYKFIFSKTKLHMLLMCISEDNKDTGEEDFMNTKKGKIITAIVILLVIYSIISTACILKLNQKINSMVVITDELREEINR